MKRIKTRPPNGLPDCRQPENRAGIVARDEDGDGDGDGVKSEAKVKAKIP